MDFAHPVDKRVFPRRVRTCFAQLDALADAAEEALASGRSSKCWEPVAQAFLKAPGFGPFRVKELLSDLKSDGRLWGRSGPKDADTYYTAGPGALRALNWLAGRTLGYALTQTRALQDLLPLRDLRLPEVKTI
jgi:hypothetical protein